MKRKVKKLFKFLAVGILALTAVGVLLNLRDRNKADEDGNVKASITWSIGGIGEDGNYVETKQSLYSSSFECKGLTIDFVFDSTIDVTAYYYDENGDFLSSCAVTPKEDIVQPEGAVTARLVITPELAEDEEIRWIDKYELTHQITVKVLAEQAPAEVEEVE